MLREFGTMSFSLVVLESYNKYRAVVLYLDHVTDYCCLSQTLPDTSFLAYVLLVIHVLADRVVIKLLGRIMTSSFPRPHIM
jgi:hypothetical protein